MPKPRVFIGSSVEGLKVAYAVQQNLLHEAEVTVWDQGIFELSRTTIESLTKALSDSDFAVFVFSPDDLVKLRNAESPSVRDNVLFEFGLFVGKLGRERVFFLVPNGGELHLPTDLLGITPGKYETDRSDNSFQAATGAACHQIRLQIKSLGGVAGRIESSVQDVAEADKTSTAEERSWIQDFFAKDYKSAKVKLAKNLEAQSGDEAINTKVFILVCELRERGDDDVSKLMSFAQENMASVRAVTMVAAMLRIEAHTQEAMEVLNAASSVHPNEPSIVTGIASCHRDAEDYSSAISVLQAVGSQSSPMIAIELAEALEKEGKSAEALDAIRRCHMKNPSNRDVRYKYGRLAGDSEETEVALALMQKLTEDFPEESDYWGYLGNAAHSLGFHDRALVAYRRAEKALTKHQNAGWIFSNIGNLLINVGLPSEALAPLKEALVHDAHSDYAHDRMSSGIKKRNAQQKQFDEAVARGVRKIKESEFALRQALTATIPAIDPGTST